MIDGQRSSPLASSRRWQVGTVFEYDPAYDVLIACRRCGRKAGAGPMAGLKLWRTRHITTRAYQAGDDIGKPSGPEFMSAEVICLDQRDCRAWVEETYRKKQEVQKRRRPDLPHPAAPRGHCKWCGETIKLDQRRKGWKRRKQRGYHRGDEWEAKGQPTDCDLRARAWVGPKGATQYLLGLQQGRCAICETQVAERKVAGATGPERWYSEGRVWWSTLVADCGKTWTYGPRKGEPIMSLIALDIDHVLPLVDGGTNALENLQVICNDPCHKVKTKREARTRARARHGEADADQLSLAA